eukprot:2724158-Amphidinium_carterae.1
MPMHTCHLNVSMFRGSVISCNCSMTDKLARRPQAAIPLKTSSTLLCLSFCPGIICRKQLSSLSSVAQYFTCPSCAAEPFWIPDTCSTRMNVHTPGLGISASFDQFIISSQVGKTVDAQKELSLIHI